MKRFILLISAIGFFLIGLSSHGRANTQPSQNENSNTSGWSDSSTDPSQDFLSNWNPAMEMSRMEQNMRKMMSLATSTRSNAWSSNSLPAAASEFEDTGKEYQINLRLPGMEKEKIDIETSNHQIHISGKQTIENQFEDDHSQRFEKSQSSFQQALPIPSDADDETIRAEYHHDILTIHLSKLSPNKLNPKSERTVAVK